MQRGNSENKPQNADKAYLQEILFSSLARLNVAQTIYAQFCKQRSKILLFLQTEVVVQKRTLQHFMFQLVVQMLKIIVKKKDF